MQSGSIGRAGQAIIAVLLCLAGAIVVPLPAAAQSLFGGRQVEVQLAAPDGKPLGDAEVRVFAPGNPTRPAATGRTDSSGKFAFTADRDGFWSAEAHRADQIARVSIRVTGAEVSSEPISPYWLFGLLAVLLGLAVCYRILRAKFRARGRLPPPRSSG